MKLYRGAQQYFAYLGSQNHAISFAKFYQFVLGFSESNKYFCTNLCFVPDMDSPSDGHSLSWASALAVGVGSVPCPAVAVSGVPPGTSEK